MADPTVELISELNILLRLTQTEAMIAQTRRAQARDSAIEKELAENAANCEDRGRRLTQAIRDLGGIPDLLGAVVGRAAANAKALMEQGQSLPEALLGDLALEHQLLDRARFARVLAESADETKVVRLLERLETAHTATVEWLNTRLAEYALGGPTAIQPTPVQTLVGVTRRIATYPARQAFGAVNRSVVAFGDLQGRAGEQVQTTIDRSRTLVEVVVESLTAGRDATLTKAEREANADGERRAGTAIRKARLQVGAVNAEDLAIKRYDDLNVATAVNRIRKMQDPEQLRSVLTYESQHKNRKGVMSAAEAQLEDTANQAKVGANNGS